MDQKETPLEHGKKLNNEKERDMKNETKKDVAVPQKRIDEGGQRDAEVRQKSGKKGDKETSRIS